MYAVALQEALPFEEIVSPEKRSVIPTYAGMITGGCAAEAGITVVSIILTAKAIVKARQIDFFM